MQRYRVRKDTLGCTYPSYPSDTVEVYLASDADAERVAYGRASYTNGDQYGRACEREEILAELKPEAFTNLLDRIRSRGESKPEPRLGTNPPEEKPAKTLSLEERVTILEEKMG
jgi:hypothetical protein